jgi:hypothetical protein
MRKLRDGTAGEIWTDGYYWGHGGGKQFEKTGLREEVIYGKTNKLSYSYD